ncbi:metallophosphoesterase family protein [Desulfogranum japonicum]|uniref:metallophosphoesterase family protein n=1 Tax=Desulfogranum japonicum TaxID=231447 RepID=UPI0004075120|nr:metallophosphoesterase family protein [Desulfogranum japonicum]
MQIAVLADIHGNYRALQSVLEDIDKSGIDEIVSLGDVVGYGPEPEEVVKALQKRDVVSVMGNHELALISSSYFNRLNPDPRESLVITRRLLSEDSLDWISNLRASIVHRGIRLVHGCPPQSITVYLFSPTENRLRRVFSTYPEKICFAGHTHALDIFRLAEGNIDSRELQITDYQLDPQARYLILPGSVGQPRDMINSKAKYAVFDTQNHFLQIKAVEYDRDTTVRLLKERDFPASNSRRLNW